MRRSKDGKHSTLNIWNLCGKEHGQTIKVVSCVCHLCGRYKKKLLKRMSNRAWFVLLLHTGRIQQGHMHGIFHLLEVINRSLGAQVGEFL